VTDRRSAAQDDPCCCKDTNAKHAGCHKIRFNVKTIRAGRQKVKVGTRKVKVYLYLGKPPSNKSTY
jgi:hypothetical protein